MSSYSRKRTLSEDSSNDESTAQRPRLDSNDSDSSFSSPFLPGVPLRHESFDSQQSDSENVYKSFNMNPSTPDKPSYSYSGSTGSSFHYKSDEEEEEDPLKISNDDTNRGSAAENYSDITGYSSVSMKLMTKMGYKKGKGLGAAGQGRVEPVEASSQKGRRGLGHSLPKMAPDVCSIKYDPDQENVSVEETVDYIPPCRYTDIPPIDEMEEWICIGPPKLVLHDENKFCDDEILRGVLAAKDVLDSMDGRELLRARSRSNPFESIGKAFFQNRAALKMANLDAICDFMFTQPMQMNKADSSILPDEVLFFADVCAAPGGFAEYAIWKRKESGPKELFPDVHGFGFTLRSNDFKLHDFFAGPREFFEPHYGVDGKVGNGDIFIPTNISNFCNYVKKATLGRGVHFMMADGGFSVEGQENIQEILSKRLYLCQFTVALGIVRKGGHFVCKLFDIFTPFSVGLIYLMYRCFNEISIHKPNTSRPANSERYIICKWLKGNTQHMYHHLFDVNRRLDDLKKTNEDIMELVPYDIMREDEDFMNYIIESNNRIAVQQIMSLQKIHLFAEDPHRVERRQGQIRRDSLALWNVPDRTRTVPPRRQAQHRVPELLASKSITPSNMIGLTLTDANSLSKIVSIFDYRFVLLSVPLGKKRDRGFVMGLGGMNVFRSDSLIGGHWERLDYSIELPSDTILYGEFVSEISNLPKEESKFDLKNQRISTSFHIIDGVVLNGYSIAKLHLTERHNLLQTFCTAVNKFCRDDLVHLRCKKLLKLEESENIFCNPHFGVRQVKKEGFSRVMYFEDRKDLPHYHAPAYGIMLLKMTQDPWMMGYSSRSRKKYFHNCATKDSVFDIPEDSISNFSFTHKNAVVWNWVPGTSIVEGDECLYDFLDDQPNPNEQSGLLCIRHVIERVRKSFNR